MAKKSKKKEDETNEVVAKCDTPNEVVANCDNPEEVIANCENPQENSLSQYDMNEAQAGFRCVCLFLQTIIANYLVEWIFWLTFAD